MQRASKLKDQRWRDQEWKTRRDVFFSFHPFHYPRPRALRTRIVSIPVITHACRKMIDRNINRGDEDRQRVSPGWRNSDEESQWRSTDRGRIGACENGKTEDGSVVEKFSEIRDTACMIIDREIEFTRERSLIKKVPTNSRCWFFYRMRPSYFFFFLIISVARTHYGLFLWVVRYFFFDLRRKRDTSCSDLNISQNPTHFRAMFSLLVSWNRITVASSITSEKYECRGCRLDPWVLSRVKSKFSSLT